MFGRLTPTVKNILFLNFGIFIIQYLLTKNEGVDLVQHYGALYSNKHPDFQPWQFVTHMFIHGGFRHIFYNMLLLFFMGPILEQTLGDQKFLILYMFSGLFAGVAMFLTYTFGLDYHNWAAVGASGACLGVLVGTALLYPNLEVHLYFLIPIKLKWIAIFTVVMDVIGFVRFTNPQSVLPSDQPMVANIAHLGGAAFSFLLITYWQKRNEI